MPRFPSWGADLKERSESARDAQRDGESGYKPEATRAKEKGSARISICHPGGKKGYAWSRRLQRVFLNVWCSTTGYAGGSNLARPAYQLPHIALVAFADTRRINCRAGDYCSRSTF